MAQQTAKEKRMDAYFKNPEPENVTSCVVCSTHLSKLRKTRYNIITCSKPCSSEWNQYQKKRADCNYKRSRKLDNVSKNRQNLRSWKERLLAEYNNAVKESKKVRSIRGNTDFSKEIKVFLKQGGVIKRLLPEKEGKMVTAQLSTNKQKQQFNAEETRLDERFDTTAAAAEAI